MIKASRKENWTVLLAAYLQKQKNKKFKWGSHDCVSFGLNGAKAITGFDYFKPMRGKYKDEAGAKKVLKTQGKGSIYSTGVNMFGKQIPISFAQRGDLVIRKKEQCVGICDGEFSVFVGAEVFKGLEITDGQVKLKTTECDYAFKVGR